MSEEPGDYPATFLPPARCELDSTPTPVQPPSLERGFETEQVRRGEWVAEAASDTIHVVRYEKDHIKKAPSGPRVSAPCLVGQTPCNDSKASKALIITSSNPQPSGGYREVLPFPRGCIYQIGQLNPILRPIQPSDPLHPIPHWEREGTERREERKERMIGSLTMEQRAEKVRRFAEKRKRRIWQKKVSYDCRRRVAERRLRIKGKFVGRDAVAALLGIEASDLSQNELVQSLLQLRGHSSMLSASNNLKIEQVQALVHAAALSKEPCLESKTEDKCSSPSYNVPTQTRLSLPSPHVASKDSGIPAAAEQYYMVASLPVVQEPIFLCKSRKSEEASGSRLKHHKI